MDKKQSREYIRHPSDVPICISPQGHGEQLSLQLNNVSMGGLCFDSAKDLVVGSVVNIKINRVKPVFKVSGIVQWSTPIEDHFEVGVRFIDYEDAFKVRMVEQVCYIDQYRRQIKAKEGRRISGDKAAKEWINKHGNEFPNPDVANT
ncbi:MAG: PilZ domain-containing protein [Pseudomonadales bacterium]|nr:PilZ domain-containing protein [Pseudomonadales bacterium]